MLEVRRRPAAPLSGTLPTITAGEWHKLVLKGTGRTITIAIDDAPDSTATIDDFVGSLIFGVREGSVDFREVDVRQIARQVVDPETLPKTDPSVKIVSPRLAREVKPNYTRSMMERGVEGIVELRALVLPDGRVGAIEIDTLPDPEMEQVAVAALKRWRFKPGTVDGQPVPVIVSIELTFKVR